MKATISSANSSARRRLIQLEKQTKPFAFISNACQWIIKFLTDKAEPKIQEIRNSKGDIYWQVYDPQRDRFTQFNSELELRTWLETHYNR